MKLYRFAVVNHDTGETFVWFFWPLSKAREVVESMKWMAAREDLPGYTAADADEDLVVFKRVMAKIATKSK